MADHESTETGWNAWLLDGRRALPKLDDQASFRIQEHFGAVIQDSVEGEAPDIDEWWRSLSHEEQCLFLLITPREPRKPLLRFLGVK